MPVENKKRRVEAAEPTAKRDKLKTAVEAPSVPKASGAVPPPKIAPRSPAELPTVAATPLPEKPTKRGRPSKSAKLDSPDLAETTSIVPVPVEKTAKPSRKAVKSAAAEPGTDLPALSVEAPNNRLFNGSQDGGADSDSDSEAGTDDASDEFFEPKRTRGSSRGSRAPRAFDADSDFLEELEDDLPVDDEDVISPDAIDIDPLDVPLELLDPELVEVPRAALPPRPKPKAPRGERRLLKCEGCGQMFGWLSVEKYCFNCLKRKLAQRKSPDENYTPGGFSGGGGGDSDDDGDDV
ncbi:hypothetical protein HZB60_10810 [candidate division KSB1 bacterium]|nr:hypothetical protein [candidate division KSB1 bacterium]